MQSIKFPCHDWLEVRVFQVKEKQKDDSLLVNTLYKIEGDNFYTKVHIQGLNGAERSKHPLNGVVLAMNDGPAERSACTKRPLE
ncbi:hypothetical protein BGX27_002119 [Mortierella sp. AM989]|nr:hypothetical protein BGX27_002119 [Mortierella sp. AM989]